MNKILLVDDEPIILSGIKHLIDWEAHGCKIVGTARNGQQALEKMDELLPNIVICDISMPVMSGLDLLEQAGKTHPEAAFIMLTNYQDFNLAREALRFQAVDYLLKTQLEPELLEKSLKLAIQESERRQKISKINLVENYISANKVTLISENIRKIIIAGEDGEISACGHILRENEVLRSYALLKFIIDFSHVPNISTFTADDKKRILEFEKDMIEKLISNFFPYSVPVAFQGCERSLAFFVWNLSARDFESHVSKLYEKLHRASDNVTQAELSLLATEVYDGESALVSCRNQLKELSDCYYDSQAQMLKGGKLTAAEYSPLNLSGQISRLSAGIFNKNPSQIKAVFEKIRQEVAATRHRRESGVSLCMELYSVAISVLASLSPENNKKYHFDNKTETMQVIQSLLSKAEILNWLTTAEDSILMQLEDLCTAKSDIIVKACDYIASNIDKHILLSDVAEHINISPSYLSALFKKQFNQNFVDYINIKKTERARELILEGKYRIYEISYMLGFENAYYFSKVFRRYTGLTPTEYQAKHKNSLNSIL